MSKIAIRLLALLFILGSPVAFIRLRPPLVRPVFAPPFYPGEHSPQGGYCHYEPYGSFCQLGTTYYTTTAGRIDHVTISLYNQATAGDLILAWGEPTGYENAGYAGYMYWSDRYAFVLSPVFRPGSRVMSVTWGDFPTEQNVWSGFVNR